MAVGAGLDSPLEPVGGVRLAAVPAGIKYRDRLDLVLIELSAGASVAATFTRNAFRAAPVRLARTHLDQATPRYLLINTGNANAGTGERGMADASRCCQALAALGGVAQEEILPFSTGVIGQPLPVEKITAALPRALASLQPGNWADCARGIMTTDTRPKALSRSFEQEGAKVTITGIAKGAGMIKPDMATMLAFVCTDAAVAPGLLREMLQEAVECSFNRITVDGDTSTNDSCVLAATGKSGVSMDTAGPARTRFLRELHQLFRELAMAIIRDAEGATKFVTIRVVNGRDPQECLAVAYAIAESPLVKTALFASDPNWGRILAAIGRAGVEDFDLDRLTLDLGGARLVENGGLAASYTEAQGQSEMDKEEIVISVDLARGAATETVWTSDLSHDYVRINAEYRT